MYEFQSSKLPRVFKWLPDSAATALEIMKAEPPTIAIVEIDNHGWVVESRPSPETMASLLESEKGAVSGASPFRYGDSGRINITVTPTIGSTSSFLSMPNKQQHLFTTPARLRCSTHWR